MRTQDVVVRVEERADGFWVITEGPEDIVPVEAREFGPAPSQEDAHEHAVSVAELLSCIYEAGAPIVGNSGRN